MDVHTADKTVIVTSSSKNFEFKIKEDTVEPVSENIPESVFDIVEQRTRYTVDRPDEPDKFDDIRFKGPYGAQEGASVLGYDIQDSRYQSLTDLMKYGINASIKVMPNGKTLIIKINGRKLEKPIEV